MGTLKRGIMYEKVNINMSLKKAIPQTGQRKFCEFGKYKIHPPTHIYLKGDPGKQEIKKTKFPNTYLFEKILKHKDEYKV